MDYRQLLSFSFSWWKEGNSIKHIALTWLVCPAFILLLAGLAFFLFPETISSLLAGNISTLSRLLLEPAIVKEMLLAFFDAALPLFLLFALALLYIQALMELPALKKAGLPSAPFPPKRFVRLVALCIANALFSLFSVFNKRFLPLLLAALVFAAATFIPDELASISSGLLSLLLFSLYCVVVFHNVIRQSLASTIFLSKDTTIRGAISESWALTANRFWETLLGIVIVKVVALLLLGLAFFALSLALTALFFYLLSLFYLSFQLAFVLSFFILLPFALLTLSYAAAGIYSGLLNKTKAKQK